MTEIALQPEPDWRRDALGILAFSIATLLILAPGDWPYGYYQFLRVVTCVFSVTVAYRAYQSDSKARLIFAAAGAIIFNPVAPFEKGKGDWSLYDLVFAIGYGAYGIGALSRQISRIVCIIVCMACATTLGATYYVNYYMPHGPSYPTGEILCGDRGPCGDEYKEDVRGLDIPSWAKFLRENLDLSFMFLPVAAICLGSKGWGKDEPPDDDVDDDDDDNDGDGCGKKYPEPPPVRVSHFKELCSPTSEGDIIDNQINALQLDDPIELAARALAKALGGSATWQNHVPTVRIVVEALAGPTASMIDAGNQAMREAWGARGLSAPAVAGDAAVAAAWER